MYIFVTYLNTMPFCDNLVLRLFCEHSVLLYGSCMYTGFSMKAPPECPCGEGKMVLRRAGPAAKNAGR